MDDRKHQLLRALDPKQPARALAVLMGAARPIGLSVDQLVLIGCGLEQAPAGAATAATLAAMKTVEGALPDVWKKLVAGWYFGCTCGRPYRAAAQLAACVCKGKDPNPKPKAEPPAEPTFPEPPPEGPWVPEQLVPPGITAPKARPKPPPVDEPKAPAAKG